MTEEPDHTTWKPWKSTNYTASWWRQNVTYWKYFKIPFWLLYDMRQSNWKNPAYIYAHLYGVHISGLHCIECKPSMTACVCIKCCSNTSTHVQFIHVKTHFLTIEHKIHGQQHCSARQSLSCFNGWKHTCYVCVGPLSLLSMSLLQ